jgi:hypothetical protein
MFPEFLFRYYTAPLCPICLHALDKYIEVRVGCGVLTVYESLSLSSESNFKHSDPRIKLCICEAKIMNSFFFIYFQIFKNVGFF